MKRIIPKSSRVKMEIVKGFSLKDLIMGMFLLLMVALLLFSNLHNKVIYIVATIVMAVLIILPINGRKLYEEIFACMRYIFSKKKFMYKYSKPIHKKEEKASKKVDESITLDDANSPQHVTAEMERIIIVDPEEEYKELANKLGGAVIEVNNAKLEQINPLEKCTEDNAMHKEKK